jgi:iron complex transport system ATP-binding protein
VTPALEARELWFAWQPGHDVIRGASFVLERGRLGALIGANGSGKSTLLRLLTGLLTPARGEALFDNTALHRIPARERARRIAWVPQSTPAAFPFTALEVVLTGRSPWSPRFHFENEADRAIAQQALETVDAGHLADRPITELSGGERQMVTLARALAQKPECLLLDEPAAALDLKHRSALVRTLAGLRDRCGLTALVVTHDLQLIDPAFDRVFALTSGRVVATGPPAEVLTSASLAAIFDDPHVRTARIGERTVVWSE